MKKSLCLWVLWVQAVVVPFSCARAATALPPAARAVDLDEHLGAALPRDAVFIDEAGQIRSFAALSGGRPLILVLGYFRCPMLCDLVLHGVANAMRGVPLALGRDYRALTVSIDPKETSLQARERQQAVLQVMGRQEAAGAWPFVVADLETVKTLTDRVGFRYAYDERTNQYAHPAVIVVLTADGRISRYLYGVEPTPKQLELAILEASRGQVGRLLDRVLLTCYRWDPVGRQYRLLIDGTMKGGGLLVLLALVFFVSRLFSQERRKKANG
jgi:protein SCO1/2